MNFVQTLNPTPFGFFDADPTFQLEADSMVTFVKRKLGDDVLSVELTKRQIWACFEEATLEYGKVINEYQLRSQLANLLGLPTTFSGTIVSGVLSSSTNLTNIYPRQTFEFLMRQAEAYSTYAGLGGVYDTYMGYIPLEVGRQDYNVYTEMLRGDGNQSGSAFFSTLPSGSAQSKLRLLEVFHFSPLAAQHFLLNASNITNFLATEFNYESYVNSTVFYVLPVFEDVLRRGMLETATRVRRSHFSYQVSGRNIRVYPIPNSGPVFVDRLWFRVATAPDPTNPSINDSTINGISNPSQIPFNNVAFGAINQLGRQWIREYTLALAKELLGLIRSKMKIIPIPGADLQLNGEDLISQAREDKDKLHTELKELFESLTYDKLIAMEAEKAENLNRMMKFIPMSRPIIIG